jgi:dUTP pyrophosphatase
MGFSFARAFLPPSRIGSRIWPSTEPEAPAAPYEPPAAEPASNGSADPLERLVGETGIGNGAPTATAVDTGTMPGHRLEADVEELRFIKLNAKATLPTRAHDSDAGLDLYAAEAARIMPGGRVSIGTGLAVAIPEGLAGLVLPRSGLALKHGVTLVNSPGLIDPGYRGEVKIVLLNTDQTIAFQVAPGDRIAQLLLVPIATASPLEADALDSSTRGAGGFGSSGF